MAQQYKFDGSSRFSIAKFDCADTGEFQERHETIREFTKNLEKINEYQQKLFAEKKEGIVFAFSGNGRRREGRRRQSGAFLPESAGRGRAQL